LVSIKCSSIESGVKKNNFASFNFFLVQEPAVRLEPSTSG